MKPDTTSPNEHLDAEPPPLFIYTITPGQVDTSKDTNHPIKLNLGIYNVVCDVGDGSKGWPAQAPFDRIIVTAAAEERPQALIDQLAVGGILIVPVGRDPTAQVVERIVKSESGLQRDTLMPVRFVPLVTGALPVLGQG